MSSPTAVEPVDSSSRDLGLPTHSAYLSLEAEYMCSLSSRKREKALLTQEMFDNIWDVLHNPSSSRISTPQFRYWVRKMFNLSYSAPTPDGEDDGDLKPIVLHENVPVAVKGQIYDILCYCHALVNHGGRDRTTAVVRQHYSWIPKELIAKFVKACPTCRYRKSGEMPYTTGSYGSPRAADCASSSLDNTTFKETDRICGALPLHCPVLTPSHFLSPADADLSPSLAPILDPSRQPASLSSVTLPPVRTLFESYSSYASEQRSPNTPWFSNSDYSSHPGVSSNTASGSAAEVMRRVNSTNDAEYPRMYPPGLGPTLPPLVKSLSDGHYTPHRAMAMPMPLHYASVTSRVFPGNEQTGAGTSGEASTMLPPKDYVPVIDPDLFEEDEKTPTKESVQAKSTALDAENSRTPSAPTMSPVDPSDIPGTPSPLSLSKSSVN